MQLVPCSPLFGIALGGRSWVVSSAPICVSRWFLPGALAKNHVSSGLFQLFLEAKIRTAGTATLFDGGGVADVS